MNTFVLILSNKKPITKFVNSFIYSWLSFISVCVWFKEATRDYVVISLPRNLIVQCSYVIIFVI